MRAQHSNRNPGESGPFASGTELSGGVAVSRLLAEGGFAFIYRGLDRAGYPVAIKTPRREEGFERFRYETELGLKLGVHPNVVSVLGSGEQEGWPYLLMEYMNVPTLSEVRRELPGKQFSAMQTARVGRDVARALVDCSRRTDMIAHRDVKMGNIFLDLDGDAGAKLSDFGIVAGRNHRFRGERRLIGVPAYLSPEVAAGATYGVHSDMFALGVVMYVMATGKVPFSHGGDGATLSPDSWSIPPLGVTHAVSGFDGELAGVIERCLHLDPAGRFADLLALYDVLDPILRRMGAPPELRLESGRRVFTELPTWLRSPQEDPAPEPERDLPEPAPEEERKALRPFASPSTAWSFCVAGLVFLLGAALAMAAGLGVDWTGAEGGVLLVISGFLMLLGIAGVTLGMVGVMGAAPAAEVGTEMDFDDERPTSPDEEAYL